MTVRIAIQRDQFVHHNGERQSFSARWTELATSAGLQPVDVDVFAPDIIPRIAACDAFMWRCSPTANPREYAKRLFYAVEVGMGKPVFPSLKSWWHFEDKIIQHYFLDAARVPAPTTRVFWSRTDAERFCDSAHYPFVLKLAIGCQAKNVCLVSNRRDAQYYVDEMFGPGVTSLGYRPASSFRLGLRRIKAAVDVVRGRNPRAPTSEAELQYGYFYAQDFVAGNDFDTRVTVIGDRAFAFRRFNRPGDFRASGSGRIDWDPRPVSEDAIRLAFRVARQLQAQTVAVDVLRRGAEPVIGELTLAYASWAVRDCPGHWQLHGQPATGNLEWVEGATRPEDAIFADFVASIPHPRAVGAIAD